MSFSQFIFHDHDFSNGTHDSLVDPEQVRISCFSHGVLCFVHAPSEPFPFFFTWQSQPRFFLSHNFQPGQELGDEIARVIHRVRTLPMPRLFLVAALGSRKRTLQQLRFHDGVQPRLQVVSRHGQRFGVRLPARVAKRFGVCFALLGLSLGFQTLLQAHATPLSSRRHGCAADGHGRRGDGRIDVRLAAACRRVRGGHGAFGTHRRHPRCRQQRSRSAACHVRRRHAASSPFECTFHLVQRPHQHVAGVTRPRDGMARHWVTNKPT
mmetsp:Transcript_794/g.4960  ORF Transcript_794/g.4960 Transcript_794/m.4960 type:complete len:266 (+) Transcript_794:1080-1877(+)